MKRDQKGFTIVELIIAVAILAIVVLAVGGFMVVGSRSYTNANTDIMLQQDAQLALNQISDVIIDTTDSISYSVDGVSVLKDAEYGGEATNKTLVVVNRGNEESNNNNKNYWFRWVKDPAAPETETGVIYFNEVDVTIDPSKSEAEQIAAIQTQIQDDLDAHFSSGVAEPDTPVLAEHVQELSIDISQFEENRVVMIAMAFENGGRQYATSNNVTVRNRIALNTIDVDPMKLADTFVIDDPGSIIIEPGESYTIPMPAVTSPAEDQALTWKSVPDITPEGTVQIGLTDTRESFNVRVERLNEQYAGQNDRVAKTVKVRIKRATAVNITCAQTTIEAGQPVELTASVKGNALGENCVNDGVGTHGTDDINKDKDVTNWRIVSGAEFVEGGIDGSGSERGTEASLTIKSTAAEGSEIIIEADSALSVRKPYDTVTGRFVIRVDKGISGDYPLQGNFKLGTWDDPGPLDYMRSHLETDYDHYIYCVRVREKTAATAANDLVVLYETTGANERFFPDLLGLTWDREYRITFQVLDPVSKETREKKQRGEVWGLYADSNEDIVNEYLAHIDPVTGKYVGDKYPADDLYSGLLSPPAASFWYNGITYPNNDKDYSESYHYRFGNANETVMGRPVLGESANIRYNSIENQLTFSVYKGEGSDPSSWETIYAYEEKDGHLGYTGSNRYGSLSVNPQGSELLKKEDNNDLTKTLGTYHIVPGFYYANNLNLNHLNYIYPVTGGGQLDTSKMGLDGNGGDYSLHYYPQTAAAITLKIEMGNMKLSVADSDLNGGDVYLNLPAPKKGYDDFWFELEKEEEQVKEGQRLEVWKDGKKYKELSQVKASCKYDPSDGSYTVHLWNTEWKPNAANVWEEYLVDLGEYKWRPGDDTWTCKTAGTGSKKIN